MVLKGSWDGRAHLRFHVWGGWPTLESIDKFVVALLCGLCEAGAAFRQFDVLSQLQPNYSPL